MADVSEDLLKIVQGYDPTLEPVKASNKFDDLMAIAQGRQVVDEPGIGTEFARGVRRGAVNVEGTLSALTGTAAQLFGAPKTGAELLDHATRITKEAEETDPASVKDISDALSSPGKFLRYTAGLTGEQIPLLALTALTGGTGAIAARTAAALGGRVATREALRKAAEIGAFAGVTGVETGATAQEQYSEVGEVSPGVALASGAVKGALELVTPFTLAARILPADLAPRFGKKFGDLIFNSVARRGLPVRIGAGMLATAGMEGITEGLQEAVDVAARRFVDENYDALGPEARSRILESAAAGALVGGVFGGLLGHVRKADASRTPVPPPTPDSLADAAYEPRNDQPPDGTKTGVEVPEGYIPAGVGENIASTENGIDLETDLFQPILDPGPAVQPGNPVDPTTDRAPQDIKGDLENRDIPPELIPALRETDRNLAGSVEKTRVPGVFVARPQNIADEPFAKGERDPQPFTAIVRDELGTRDFSLDPIHYPSVDTSQVKPENKETVDNLLAAPETIRSPHNVAQLVGMGVRWGTKLQREAFKSGRVPTQGQIYIANENAIREIVGGPSLKARQLVKPILTDNEVRKDQALADLFRNGGQRINLKTGRTSELVANPTFNDVSYAREVRKGKNVEVLIKPDLSDKQRANLRSSARLIESFMEKFGLNKNHKLYIIEHQNERFGGYYAQAAKNTHIISINRKQLDDAHNALWVTAHEFGHMISLTSFLRAGPGMQERILEQYNNDLRRTENKTGLEFATLWGSPAMASVEGMRSLGKYRRLPIDLDYWYGFDEWFAEQVARWVFTSQKPMGTVERFFNTVANRVKTMWREVLGLDSMEKLRTSQVMEDWLDSIYDRQQPPILMQGRAISQRESEKRNEIALGGPPDYVPPEQASTLTAKNVLMSDVVKKLLPDAMTPAAAQHDRNKALAQMDKYSWFIKTFWNMRQIIMKNRHIPGMTQYEEAVDAWNNLAQRWKTRADQTIRFWQRSKEQSDKVGKLLIDLNEMDYLKSGEAARHPTDAEFAALVAKHGIDEKGLAIYERVKGDFNAVLDAIESTMIREATRISDPIARQNSMNEIAKSMTALRGKPYFPMARFGNWTLVVRDPKGNVVAVEAFETKAAQITRGKSITKEYPEGKFQIHADRFPEEIQVFRGFPPSMLRHIQERMGLSQEQKAALQILQYELSPAVSFKHHLERRSGIAGYSHDMIRSYAQYFFHAANHLARIRYYDDMEQAITKVKQSADFIGQTPNAAGQYVDVGKRRQLTDYMTRHKDYIMNPTNEWGSVRSLAFQWWLGFNPTSALLNFTQIPMVAYPHLAARFGDAQAISALSKGAFQVRNIYSRKPVNVPFDLAQAIDKATQEGILDEGQAVELAGIAEGGNLSKMLPGTQFDRYIRQAGVWSGFMFQASEKYNRRVVFRAAYELAKNNPDAKFMRELAENYRVGISELMQQNWTRENALAYYAAKTTVNDTQFPYGRHARPEFMRGKQGAFFAFFMFKQNMLWFARHDAGRTRFLLLMLAVGGLTGLPGAEDLFDLAKFFARQLGINFDAEKEIREFAKYVGFDKPDILLHGASRYGFGTGAAAQALGLPIPNVDFSANMSMGKIVPGIEALARGGDYNKMTSAMVEQTAGAAFGVPIAIIKALTDDQPDQAKRWERAMPRVMKNAERAFRYFSEGKEKSRTGATILRFDPHDPQQMAEIVAQGLGLNPTRLTQKWDQVRFQTEQETYWKTRRGMLLTQMDYARQQADREGVADVREAIRRYNSEAPRGLTIGGDDIARSMRERQRARALAERDLPRQKSYRGLARENQSLFPEVEPLRGPRAGQEKL